MGSWTWWLPTDVTTQSCWWKQWGCSLLPYTKVSLFALIDRPFSNDQNNINHTHCRTGSHNLANDYVNWVMPMDGPAQYQKGSIWKVYCVKFSVRVMRLETWTHNHKTVGPYPTSTLLCWELEQDFLMCKTCWEDKTNKLAVMIVGHLCVSLCIWE